MLWHKEDLGVEEVMQGIAGRAPDKGEHLLIEEFTYEPGVAVPGHTHGGEQFGYIVSGELEMTIAGKNGRLGPGDFYRIPSHTQHHLVASSRVVTVLVTALAEESHTDH
jgi:quercetin dioxygenase-like cupin family protein